MWLRYRNKQSGHEASLPVDVGPYLPDWEPVDDAEPSPDFQEPTYAQEPLATAQEPVSSEGEGR